MGTLDPPARVVELENPACGDILRLSALVQDGIIVEVRFQVRGCTASIACAAALAEWLADPALALSLFHLSHPPRPY